MHISSAFPFRGYFMGSFRTARRSMKIWAQVNKALYPFSNRTHVLMDGPGKIQRKHRGDLELSFYERVLLELPRDKVRRFVYPIGSDPEPEEAEFAKWRRLLLGTARRI